VFKSGRSATGHVQLSELFRPATSVELASARLVDGRAIHHYLLFIEPVVLGNHDLTSQLISVVKDIGADVSNLDHATPIHDSLLFFCTITAEGLLVDACQEFIARWIAAELAVRSLDACYLMRHKETYKVLVESFVSSVVWENYRRLDSLGTRPALKEPHDFLAVVDTVPANPLTAELVACWYPKWNRVTLIYDSPFDPMTSLSQML
jgi:hypothetical protein